MTTIKHTYRGLNVVVVSLKKETEHESGSKSVSFKSLDQTHDVNVVIELDEQALWFMVQKAIRNARRTSKLGGGALVVRVIKATATEREPTIPEGWEVTWRRKP